MNDNNIRKQGLQKLATIFDQDPKGVTDWFASFALECIRVSGEGWDGIERAAIGDGCLSKEVVSAVFGASMDAELVEVTFDEEYRLNFDHHEMLLVGARHWLESMLNAVREPPPVQGITRDEIETFVEKHYHLSVSAMVRELAGTGHIPREVDREVVGEVLLSHARTALNHAYKLREILDGIQCTAENAVGNFDDAYRYER